MNVESLPVISQPRERHGQAVSILTVIVTGNGHDEAGDVDPVGMTELLDRLSYRTSEDSMQFSIRALVEHGVFQCRVARFNGAGPGYDASRVFA